MPFYEAGDLLQFLTAKKQVNTTLFLQIFLQLSKALAIIHSRSLIHRDVKLQNIFVSDYDGSSIRVCLGDYGCFIDMENTKPEEYHSFGSETYKPPESNEGIWSTKSDVWSLGVCMLQLACPQKALTTETLLNAMEREEIFQTLPKQLPQVSNVRSI